MAAPEIRFEGFESEWAKGKFDKSFDFLATNTLSRAQLNYSTGEALNIHYGDVLTILGDITRVNETALPFINDSYNFQKSSSNRLRDGDVVIADTAEDETVGKATEVQGISDTPVFSGLHTFACRPTAKFSPGFLGYYLNSPYFHDQIVTKAQGTKVSSISKSQLQETEVSLPELAEQANVSNYFTSLDSLIDGAKKSAEQLKNFKQSMLVKMFPQGGASVPEIRFEGFTGDWQEKRIIEIASATYGGGTPSTTNPEYWAGDIPWIQSSDLDDESIVFHKARRFVSSSGIKNSATVLVPGNSIAVVTRVGVGKAVIVDNPYATSQDFISLSGIEGNLRFITISVRISILGSLNQLQGSTIKGITRDELLNKVIYLPFLEEQAAIGSYFRQLDQLIELEEAKLAKLTQLKTAFLSKMFV